MDKLGEGIAALRTWSVVARAAIGLFLFVLVALIVANSMMLYTELTVGTGFVIYNPAFAAAIGATNVLIGLFFLLAAVPIAVWIYRAHANLHEAGVDELRYSPGWTVGSYFVPLANLVVPFRAMRELHNRSHGEKPWDSAATVGDVTSWWSCQIAAVGVSTVALLVALLTTIPNLNVVQPPGVNTGLLLFALALFVGAAIYLFRTVSAVTGAQRQMLHLNHSEVFG